MYKKICSGFLLSMAILATTIHGKEESATPLSNKTLAQATSYTVKNIQEIQNIIPLAIIGSGPAGLSAALYGARSALHTVVFEGENLGGQLAETTYIENWPGVFKAIGCTIIETIVKQAQSYGAVFVSDSIASVDFSQWPYRLQTSSGDQVHALAVVIATGASPRFLNHTRTVPGEWEYMGKGVSTCAVCDAPFYKDRKVVVVGGGDSAVEEALYLASYTTSVTLLVRGNALRASPIMQDRLKELETISVLYNTQVDAILGDESSVKEVVVSNTLTKEASTISTDGVFIAIGHIPATKLFTQWGMTDESGYILVESKSQQTAIPGVFAAGDVYDSKYRQAGVAAGDGIKAALDAYAFLRDCGYSPVTAQQIQSHYYRPENQSSVASDECKEVA